MKKNKLIKDNRGFTLVELIVTLLVSSFVILAASFFLTASLSTFNRNNTEVSLQMESQIALNLVENLVVEATSCRYFPDFEYTVHNAEEDADATCPVFAIGTKDGSGSRMYLVILKESTHQLLIISLEDDDPATYCNVVDDFDMATARNEVSAQIASTRPQLLANYITDFSVTPLEVKTDTDELVQLVIKLNYMDKSYDSSSNISLRNGVHR